MNDSAKYWREIAAGALEDVEQSEASLRMARETVLYWERRVEEDRKSLAIAQQRLQEANGGIHISA